MILGTYHMSNPGKDIHNLKADDVLVDKRQRELADVAAGLAKFKPTKVVVEQPAENGAPTRLPRYHDYLDGKMADSRNEVAQVGYRLGKQMKLAEVWGIDVDGDFPWLRVVNYAKANGVASRFDSLNAGVGVMVKEQGDFLGSHTLLETLQMMNADQRVARDMGFYFSLVRFGVPFDYAGSDLLAAWYQRNIRIYRNIVALIDSPDERILVIYGSGHLGWLRQDVADDPTVKLRKLSEVTPP
jgi:hypothetical protein